MRDMQLELDIITISDIKFGEKTGIDDGILTINKEEMLAEIQDDKFKSVDIELARPGEPVRLIPVKDVVEPRIKPDGNSFPGIIGEFEGCGSGRTRILKGCAVTTVGKIVGFQEGIIDMSGPGAKYTRYSGLNNVVINADPIDDLHQAKYEEAVRLAGVKGAHYLARATMDAKVSYTESRSISPLDDEKSKSLPQVGIMYLLMAQGLLHDNFLYGVDAKRLHPAYLHPNELMDGALVSGNCVVAGDKSTTYDHQNNMLVDEMIKRHGKDINFKGIILVPTYPGLSDKKRCCSSAVNMARLLNLDGVVLPEEGGGNPEADLMMLCRGCEAHDIKTVMMLGPDGVEEPLADTTEEADAVINVGDCNEFVVLPSMEKVIGHPEQVTVLSGGSDTSIQEDGSIRVSLSALMGSVIGQGYHKLSSFVY